MAFQATRFHLISLTLLSPLLSSILVASKLDCRIKLNSSLTAGSNSPPWLSPSGEFAFGFRPPVRSPSDNKNLFVLSIWFHKAPEQTIVWSKNDHPVSEGSRIQLTNAGELVLYNSQGQEVWKAWTGGRRSTCAAMLNSGKFVLMNGDSGNYIWESFNTPKDIFLSGQRLGMEVKLMSRQSALSVVPTTPVDMCRASSSGGCGYNSYCVNLNGRPNCLCPEGYSPFDPSSLRRGCRPDFELPSCQQNGWDSNAESVEFKELNNTDWPSMDYELQIGAEIDKERCKEFCLRDCFCAAAIYNGNSCWKKKFPLMNGRQSTDVNRTALIKVPKNVTGTCPKGKDQSTLLVIESICLGSSLFLNLLLLIAIAVAVFVVYHKKLMNLQSPDNTSGVRRFTYKELHEASDGFKQQLGRGSFGTVYKGVITSIPKKYVAIKKLDEVKKEGEKEFTTEVRAIGRTHHKNLVTLLGYCDEGNHRLLVYEYMSNGSLSGIVFGVSRPHWNQRMQIALGIARGLTYLHEECSTQIIHCDIKPQNILLDESLKPKISDFGLAKLLLSEQSRAARTHIRGTVGYFAPEWFRKASISVKVDVYSFGVMLLEMICCMSSVEFAFGDQEEAFVDWVYDCYRERQLNVLVENDEEAKNDMGNVERLVMVAIWCIQEDPSLRPSIGKVTQMLEGVAQVSVPPRPSVCSSS